MRKYVSQRVGLFATWSPADLDVFCGLVCKERVLTIGAPSSPALSNAICHDLDVSLHAVSEACGAVYTRYADDLFFSIDRPNVLKQVENDVIKQVSELKLPEALKINAAKTRHSSKKRVRRVTGIVLGSDGHPYIGRKLKRKIRSLVHKYSSLGEQQRASLAGLIAYSAGFDPDFVNSLINKYGLPVIRNARLNKQ